MFYVQVHEKRGKKKKVTGYERKDIKRESERERKKRE